MIWVACNQEIDKTISLEESLRFSEVKLAKCEADLQEERTAREETEEDLMRTMTELASCQRENRVITESLSRCQDELQQTSAALASETAAREMLQTKLDSTVEVCDCTYRVTLTNFCSMVCSVLCVI